jgi:lysozyme family protein
MAILAAVVAVEGGYVNHPNDPGGETNWGITEAVARECGYKGRMKDMLQSFAISCYNQKYVIKPGFLPLVEIDEVVAEEVVDTGVNMGPSRPSRFFQRAVNEACGSALVVDGKIGARTVDTWRACRNRVGRPACVSVLNVMDRQQEAEYDRLVRVNPKLRVFRRGWQNHRINNVDRRRCQ